MSAIKVPASASIGYVSGLNLSMDALLPGTVVDIAAGQCHDSNGLGYLTLQTPSTVSFAVSGLGGLDAGVMAVSSLYHVFVIGDESGARPNATLLSLSATAPLLPSRYSIFRRIGSVATNATAAPATAIIPFFQASVYSNSAQRDMYYDADIVAGTLTRVLNAGAATVYTAVNCALLVPPVAAVVYFHAVVTAAAAGGYVNLCVDGLANPFPMAQLGSAAAAVAQRATMVCPSSAAAVVDYENSAAAGTTSLFVAGYRDNL